jgi:nucleoside-diphosphate-sugar epimerase
MAADETTPLREDQGIGTYKRSKIAAERLVEAMVAERGLAVVIVNPSTPIGPCDVRPTPTGRIIVEAAKGRIPAFIDTGLNLVHVDDVASGHLAAPRPASAAAMACRYAVCFCCGGGGALHGPGTICDPGRRSYGEIPHVLRIGQGRAGTRVSPEDLY